MLDIPRLADMPLPTFPARSNLLRLIIRWARFCTPPARRRGGAVKHDIQPLRIHKHDSTRRSFLFNAAVLLVLVCC